MTQENKPAENYTIKPSRRRTWAKRIGAAMLLLVVGLVAAHYIWGRVAERRLTEQLRAYAGRNEPVTAADLLRGGVPDAQNAALDLRAAAKSIDLESEDWKAFEELEWDQPLDEAQWAFVQKTLKANAAALAAVRGMAGKTGADWQIQWQAPMLVADRPEYRIPRPIARLLVAAAREAHRAGRDRETIDYLLDVRRTAEATRAQVGLIGQLIAAQVDTTGADTLASLAPELRIGDADGAIPPRQARQLIDALLASSNLTQRTREALWAERVMILEVLAAVRDGNLRMLAPNPAQKRPSSDPLSTAVTGYALKPMLCGDGLMIARRLTAATDALANASTWPEYHRSLPKALELRWPQLHPFVHILLPATQHFVQNQFRAAAMQRLAATSLAIRWYAVEHDGKLPAKLEDLVPKYLPAVPADALGEGGLRYDPQKKIIYSVGANGADDGGSEASRSEYNRRLAGEDIVIRLVPQPPATQPAR